MNLFLFAKTENRFIRIIKNIIFYSFIFTFICMFLVVGFSSLAKPLYIFMSLCSIFFCVGLCILVVCGVMWFVKELWLEQKEYINSKKRKKQQAILEKASQMSKFLLKTEDDYYDENDVYHYCKMEYFLTPDGKIILKKTSRWHDAHNILYGSSYIFYQYMSFDEFNSRINSCNDENIKKYAGISKANYMDYIKSDLKTDTKYLIAPRCL